MSTHQKEGVVDSSYSSTHSDIWLMYTFSFILWLYCFSSYLLQWTCSCYKIKKKYLLELYDMFCVCLSRSSHANRNRNKQTERRGRCIKGREFYAQYVKNIRKIKKKSRQNLEWLQKKWGRKRWFLGWFSIILVWAKRIYMHFI